MLTLIQTSSDDPDFRELVKLLDADLALRDGKDHLFFAQYNKLDTINHVVVAYFDNAPAGCGAIKKYDDETMEVKRMFVKPEYRGKGIARAVLSALEKWSGELGYAQCILETGKRQPEAITLYKTSGYSQIPNYGQYENVETSVCFKKRIVSDSIR
ncbi:MAG: GNAT family N-acetyltransferase [Bacteroidota bacterium]